MKRSKIKINNININHAIDEEINFYFQSIDCGFKKFETINRKNIGDLLKVWTIYKAKLL